jgi:HEAT repeats
VALAMARRKEFEGRLLAILDPDLRHSTPSRRQSAALITVLALSASLVAAAAPMPRVIAAPSGPLTRDMPATTAHQQPANDRQAQETRARDLAAVATPRPVSPARREAALSPAPRPAAIVAPAERADTRADAMVNPSVPALPKEGSVTRASSAERQQAPDDRATLLAKVLRTDSSAHLRRIAAWGLSDFSSSSVATDALVNAVAHDADAHVREMAAWSLSNYEHDAAVAAALGAAVQHDASEEVRATAAWALGNEGSRASADALTAGLSDSSSRVRERAAWALGNVQPKQAPASLIAMLRDPSEECRHTAAWALHEIGDPAALPALESALRAATDEGSQITYLRAIAVMGDRSVDVIRNLLDSSNPRIKSMAVRVLAGGEATGPWPEPRPEPRPFP